ncbi:MULTISPECIES: hypothetical protein [Streptomyces]|uniref:hypothetical protein n=1 Tax=Streptomyces TaxID=1883 RepID=UPI00345B5707
MPLIRKEHAGSDSHGHLWAEDGAVVEVDDPDQVAALLAIDDGGFSEVTPGDADKEATAEFTEIDPQDTNLGAPKPAGRRGRKPSVQE